MNFYYFILIVKHKELQAKQMNSIDGNSRDRIKKIFLKIK